MCAFSSSLVGQSVKKSASGSKPNVIYILADDMGYGDLGCYGQQDIRTPYLDQMAKDGMLFTQHYAGSSVCAPSRASLMTGKHTGTSRVRGNYEDGKFGFGSGLELEDKDITIAELLKANGYATSLIGKWGLGVAGTTGEPIKQGFDYSFGFLNQGHAHYQFPDYLFRNGVRVEIPENKNGATNYFSNDIFTTEAIKNINKNAKKPFFMYLALTTPHAEMLVPEGDIFKSYLGKFQETPFMKGKQGSKGEDSFGAYGTQLYPATAYAAQITLLDSCVGVLMAELKRLKIDQNTIVMFSSDNGPHYEGGADPNYFKSSGPFKGRKRDLYEGGVRVPFIVKWPSVIKPNSKSEHISAFWDLMPTLADIVKNKKIKLKTDGISFLPTLQGGKSKQVQHKSLYWEFHESKYTDQAVRMGDWKAVRHNPDGEMELYNLKTDIAENNNVAATNPGIVAQMKLIFNNTRTPHDIWKITGSSNYVKKSKK